MRLLVGRAPGAGPASSASSSHVVRDFPGEAKVVLSLETSEGPKMLELGPDYRVKPVPDFFAEVKALLGEAAVSERLSFRPV